MRIAFPPAMTMGDRVHITALPRVVIVGGGFGGLAAGRELAGAPLQVTLVDSRNYHLFQPLLYQVATAALNPADIAVPIRRILRYQRNLTVLLGCADSIDLSGRRVILCDGELPFDYLILATGATHSYFGHDEWREPAPGLKTVEDAIEIRRRVLVAYEAAEREPDIGAGIEEWMTFVIVGGGPTGVELAGALAEISRRVLERDFRRIKPRLSRIVLIEAADRVLPSMSPHSSAAAERELRRLGVEVMLSTPVLDVDDSRVCFKGGQIATHTVLWAAGVAASPIGRSLGVPLDRHGRVMVNQDLTIPGTPRVFVIGDLAQVSFEGQQVPGVAAAAMQEGRHAARMILRAIRGARTEPFHYFDKGVLAAVGRGVAVADLRRLKLSGFVAWLAWLFVHIFYLIGFRSRFFVIAQWAIVYLRNERGARLITGNVEPLLHRGRHQVEPADSPPLENRPR